eukprot:6037139-Prymnesium_polylepis.1
MAAAGQGSAQVPKKESRNGSGRTSTREQRTCSASAGANAASASRQGLCLGTAACASRCALSGRASFPPTPSSTPPPMRRKLQGRLRHRLASGSPTFRSASHVAPSQELAPPPPLDVPPLPPGIPHRLAPHRRRLAARGCAAWRPFVGATASDQPPHLSLNHGRAHHALRGQHAAARRTPEMSELSGPAVNRRPMAHACPGRGRWPVPGLPRQCLTFDPGGAEDRAR